MLIVMLSDTHKPFYAEVVMLSAAHTPLMMIVVMLKVVMLSDVMLCRGE
jgi:hypothetical protein